MILLRIVALSFDFNGGQGIYRNVIVGAEDADQAGALFAAILGERELEAQTFTVKELATAEQSNVPFTDFVAFFSAKISLK